MPRGCRPKGVVISISLVLAVAGCGSDNLQKRPVAGMSSVAGTGPVNVLPPTVNEAKVMPRPVSRLQPGIQVLVGEGSSTTVCTSGFYLDFPDPGNAGQRTAGFVIGAQCAHGDEDAPVFVMKSEADGLASTRTKVGEIIYRTPGEARPNVADRPWTMPTSPLAVFSSGPGESGLTVGGAVNGEPPTADAIQTADVVQRRQAHAMWTDLDGRVVAGRVVDPAAAAELRDIPPGIDRVVVAADDPNTAIDAKIIGAPVTADVDGSIANLGIITAVDPARRWVVVDLIAPFLVRHNAVLVVSR